MILRSGTKFKVIKNNPRWNEYAQIGWTGTIKEYIREWNQYSVKWDNHHGLGDLVGEEQIIALDGTIAIKEITKYGIALFLEGIEKNVK